MIAIVRLTLIFCGMALIVLSTALMLARPAKAESHWLAYVSQVDDQLYVMRADGRLRRRVTNFVAGHHFSAWSSDGKWILFTRSDDAQIYRVRVTDGRIEQITHNAAGYSDYNPVFSPDGRWVYYLSHDPAHSPDSTINLYRTAWEGGAPQQLTHFENQQQWIRAIGFAPNGKWAAFSVSGRHAIRENFYALDLANGRLYPLAQPLGSISGCSPPEWSPDSEWVLLAVNQGGDSRSCTIYLMRPDGSEFQRLLPIENRQPQLNSVWSPNGNWIAISLYDNTRPAFILTRVRRAGTDLQRLSYRLSYLAHPPQWSGGGTWLAFHRSSRTSSSDWGDLYRIQADGTDARLLTDDAAHFMWSPVIDLKWAGWWWHLLGGMGIIVLGRYWRLAR